MNVTHKQPITVDFLVIGGGVAGLQAAITLSDHGRVLVVNKGDGCSTLAQGGVAVALDETGDGRQHLEDTLRAGKGECDPEMVSLMVAEGPARIADLESWGACFDRDPAGEYALAKEAAHSRRRILRAGGDATGKELVRALTLEVSKRSSIDVLNGHFVSELLMDGGQCVGALLLSTEVESEVVATAVVARSVLLASGGAGQVYRRTSNPQTATGDGIAMAQAAGASLRHMEFVQFHPTVLAEPYPPFLLSEAMRGEGGVLRNEQGEAFMARYHPQRELAPRDEVARAIWSELSAGGHSHVYLDMTALSRERLTERFPTISATCMSLGLDVASEPIPVAPSAHFLMGGVQVDQWGRTDVPGLFATGEVACSGVHGANRLASNSLLEALVFGARSGEAMAKSTNPRPGADAVVLPKNLSAEAEQTVMVADIDKIRGDLQARMWDTVGLVREACGMRETLRWIETTLENFPHNPYDANTVACANLLRVGCAITRAALERGRGVGAHYRSDEEHGLDAAARAS